MSADRTDDRAITLPYLDLSDVGFGAVTMATLEQRWKLLTRLFATCDRIVDDVPEAWADHPLTAWCWLVLVENDIPHDDDVQKPLVHFGIDMGFSSEAVRTWVWFLA